MASTWSSLKFELIGTGEQAGTWGTTTNANLGDAIEQAIAGKADITMSSTTVTLTLTDTTALQDARALYLNLSGTPGGAAVLEVPAIEKSYIVKNGSDQIVTVKVTGQTGVAVPVGKTVIVYNNGTDVVTAIDAIPDLTVATLTATSTATFAAGAVGTPSITTTGDTNTGIFFPAADTIAFAEGGVEAMRIDSSGNVGIGTSSPATTLNLDRGTSAGEYFRGGSNGRRELKISSGTGDSSTLDALHDFNASSVSGVLSFSTGSTERMRIDSSGNLLVGATAQSGTANRVAVFSANKFGLSIIDTTAQTTGVGGALNLGGNYRTTGDAQAFTRIAALKENSTDNNFAYAMGFYTTPNGGTFTERMRITAAGYTQPVAYADTVVALGNSGTATTITLTSGNVFTATLTGNCTFTLSAPIATGSSSFTLILTNDGTAGRTVAWSGGTFLFPGGAASLSRTTTANAVDVWVFFTPDGGTTWYGNIAMKNMTT